ncbi:MAG: prephenate dehydratase [Candidatus Omnitrophota bacterium]
MSLEKLRGEIDRIDEKILKLLNSRAGEALKVNRIKRDKKIRTYSPDREETMLKRLKGLSKGLFKAQDTENVFREILSACRAQNANIKIAYLGPEHTFTHIAALKKFGKSVDYLECSSIADVFTEVERGRADYGVVPIENSTEGAVNHTLDMFLDSELKICSEMYLSIEHNLLSRCKKISSVKNVYSHQQVFAQCRKWLEKNLPNAKLTSYTSTTQAAMYATLGKGRAAIASKAAAEEYELNILARSIEDSAHNITRFLIIGRQDVGSTKQDKTSIVFSMKDKAGALHDALVPFKRNNINLTKIESRPSKKKAWKYYFFVDMQGHKDSPPVRKAIRALEKECLFVKILGSYPKES